MQITRRSALLSGVTLGALAGFGSFAAAPNRRNLVVVQANGGWDTSYGLDPKPDSPFVDGPELDPDGAAEAVETFAGIPVAVHPGRRPSVGAFFAQLASDAVVVNGIDVGTVSHDVGRIRVLTGTPSNTNPDVLAILGATHGSAVAVPYFDLGGGGFSGDLAAVSGRVGAVNQLKLLLDPAALGRAGFPTDHDYPLFAPTRSQQSAIDAYLQGEVDALAAVMGDDGPNDRRIGALRESLDRAGQLRDDAGVLSPRLSFGRALSLEAQGELAVDLLALGMSRAVLVDSGGSWDTHDDNPQQSDLHEGLFAGLLGLAEGLDDAGLYDDTVVVVLSEFGRTPRRNSANGKDHWPVTSALVFGGPVRGGRVIGATTDEVAARPVDLATGRPDDAGLRITHERFVAGLLSLLEVDPSAWLPDAAVLRALA